MYSYEDRVRAVKRYIKLGKCIGGATGSVSRNGAAYHRRMTVESDPAFPTPPGDAGGASTEPAAAGAPATQPPAAEVDARGLNCPLPILKAKKALSTLASGQVLKVLATDPGSVRDFNAFARQTGNALVQIDESPQTTHAQHGPLQWAFYLRRR